MEYPGITEGVKNLLGDPKKAIAKLSGPMIIAMVVLSFYQVTDGIWVAGLGADELAAVGLFFPFLIIILAIGNGLGTGGSSAISRRIGSDDKKGADNVAIHTIMLGILVGLLITVLFLPITNLIFLSLSNTNLVGYLSIEYAQILFAGTIIIILACIFSAIFRGEGDAKKSMYGLAVGSILNIFLDPIFIYVLDLGVAGAALATILSLSISAMIFIYWLFVKRTSFLHVTFKGFNFNKNILKDVLRVGIPSSAGQISISLSLFILNIIARIVNGNDGIAVLTSGWRIMMIAVMPVIGMAPAVTAVTGAAYGARNKRKLYDGYIYAIKLGFMVELLVAVGIFVFAPQIAVLFSYSADSSRIFSDLVTFLRVTSVYYITAPIGIVTTAMFRGVGHGMKYLIITGLRALVLQTIISYILAVILNYGLLGIWIGMVIGAVISVILSVIWARITINKIF